MDIQNFINEIKAKKKRVGVIGDTVLDVYLYGKVSRISPEFPVPVLHSDRYAPEYCPGGAANVCHQFRHFNASVKLFSLLDNGTKTILQPLINVKHCVDLRNGTIPQKIRYYDGEFPLLRSDIEQPQYGVQDLTPERDALLWNLRGFLPDLDVVIISNYNKGLFDKKFALQVISACRENNVPTIVDPKSDPAMWAGCTIFKPNAAEAKRMTGCEDWKEQCVSLKQQTGCDGVVITQQGSGVVGLADGEFFRYRPKTTTKDVSSVIGAGDCFAAVLALGFGLAPLDLVAGCAFEAGAEYVKARHNRPIALYELHRRLDPLGAKIVTLDDLLYLRNGIYGDMRWVMTNGCFDFGLTRGHVECLKAAKHAGDKLVVAVNSDDSVRKLKGKNRPLVPLHERMAILAALESSDFVISFDDNTPLEIIKKLMPDVVVKGGDYRPEDVAGYGLVDILIIPSVDSVTTTNKIEMNNDLRTL